VVRFVPKLRAVHGICLDAFNWIKDRIAPLTVLYCAVLIIAISAKGVEW